MYYRTIIQVEIVESSEVDKEVMTKLLLSQGSDPEFFNIEHSFSA